jgi:succinyl-diaminopimelate desuccinylase
MTLNQLLNDLLAIESPTYKEQHCVTFCETWLQKHTSLQISRVGDNIIAFSSVSSKSHHGKPHLAFVGHLDVVPTHFDPIEKEGLVHGAGASDMKGGIAGFLWFIKQCEATLLKHYQLSVILYSREEGTKIEDNGLYEVIQSQKEFLQTIDLAIVAEPTNNTIQLGCVGSIHATVRVEGKSAHSARPWDGENALYNAIPVIRYFSEQKPVSQTVLVLLFKNIIFRDIISITESHTEKGRTTIPGYWQANINFRYAPVHQDPEKIMMDHCIQAGIQEKDIVINDHVPAGQIIESSLFKQVIKQINQPIEAKQAWTDVAQLSQLGIPSFNFGPGFTEQAHKSNEYIKFSMLQAYIKLLERVLPTGGSS